MSELHREHRFVQNLNAVGDSYEDDSERVVTSEQEANLVTSTLVDQSSSSGTKTTVLHAPVLDIDFDAKLIPSSTPGHFHLYLQKAMTWDDYVVLLNALGNTGILEPGYVASALRRGYSSVRKPGVYKQEENT